MVTRKDICNYLHRCIKMRLNSVYGIRILSLYERSKWDSAECIQYREECAKQEFRSIMDCIALIMIERGEY